MSECLPRRYNANEHKSTRGSESVDLRFGIGSAQEYPCMVHRVEPMHSSERSGSQAYACRRRRKAGHNTSLSDAKPSMRERACPPGGRAC